MQTTIKINLSKKIESMVRIPRRHGGDLGLNSIKHIEIQFILTCENCWILNWEGMKLAYHCFTCSTLHNDVVQSSLRFHIEHAHEFVHGFMETWFIYHIDCVHEFIHMREEVPI